MIDPRFRNCITGFLTYLSLPIFQGHDDFDGSSTQKFEFELGSVTFLPPLLYYLNTKNMC